MPGLRGRDGLNGPPGPIGDKGERGLDAPPPVKGQKGSAGNFFYSLLY